MRYLVMILALLAAPSLAQEEGASDPISLWQADRTVPVASTDLPVDAFRWVARPVVVFADSPFDPRFDEQMTLLTARPDDLARRDVVIITDTDPNGRSAWREALRPRGFMLVIMEKDGTLAARKPAPRDTREISRQIDKMPLRQQEMRDRHGAAGR